MRRVLISLFSIGVIAIVAVFATQAFFNDTETSVGNVLQAGALDLKIDNTCYYNGKACIVDVQTGLGHWDGTEESCSCTWKSKDLESGDVFFSLFDLKPGDWEEDTISVNVDNSSWLCADIKVTRNADNSCTEPEQAAVGGENGACVAPNGPGELAKELNFVFWKDDGDNVYECGAETAVNGSCEQILTEGPADAVLGGESWALADSTTDTGPIPAKQTFYIGKFFCFGTLTKSPLQQDNVNTGNPVSRQGSGFLCDGKPVDNKSQTDSLEGDISFYAEQFRHNEQFTCSGRVERIGAALASYVQPTTECDAFVDDSFVTPVAPNFLTIQGAINDAGTTPGETVCVDAGTYNEDVVINKEITLSGDGATATSTINGQAVGQGAAVKIAANNVTLEGFNINGAGIAALWLNTGVTGAAVRYNKITSAAGGVTAVTTQGDQANHNFNNNEFVGNASGQIVYVNGDVSLGAGQESDNVDFDHNTFSGTIVAGGVALGSESINSEVTSNILEGSLTSTYALYESWKDDALVNFNNFYDTLGVIVRDSDPGAGPLNAENNWWGEAVPAGHTAGNVDDVPKEAAAFPEN